MGQVGVPGSQYHIDGGIQLGGDVCGAPLGFEVKFAHLVDGRLGSCGAARRADEPAVVGRDAARRCSSARTFAADTPK